MSDSVRPHRRQPIRLPRPWDSPGKNTGVSCHFLLQCMKVKSQSEVAQSYLTPSDPMDCSPPGPSVHGIFQARVLEWGAIAFSREAARQAHTHTHTQKAEPFQIPVLAFQDVPVTFPAELVFSASKFRRVRDFILIARVRMWGRRRTAWTVLNFIHCLIPVLTNPQCRKESTILGSL